MQVENSDWKNESSIKVRIKKKHRSVKGDRDESSPSWFWSGSKRTKEGQQQPSSMSW